MQSLEQSAKTVDEAIGLALHKLGVSRDEVEVLVLGEGRAGIFGIGAEDARVRVTVLQPKPNSAVAAPQPTTAAPDAALSEAELPAASVDDQITAARAVLADLLPRMGIDAEVVVRSPAPDAPPGTPPTLDITGEDLGILIGRRGATLGALQFMTNLIASKRLGRQVKVPVDVEAYRSRREASLRALAVRLADRVVQTRQPVTLEEMPPAERRVVHLALAEHPQVVTRSTGEGEHRKVVILPKR